MTRPIIWSYGGGVQSVAIACLIAQGRLPVPERAVIADTSREISTTWEYLDLYVRPMLANHGLQVEIASHDLASVDVYSTKGDILMPVFTQSGKLPTFCSVEWKRRVVNRYLVANGYGPKNPITTWIGFSVNEIGRCNTGDQKWQEIDWPLIDMQGKYGTRMNREECANLIVAHGLPPAPRSACRDCPHRRNTEWREVRNRPEEWALACETDKQLREHDISRGGSGVYLHSSRVPLEEATLEDVDTLQLELEGPTAECASGLCWT